MKFVAGVLWLLLIVLGLTAIPLSAQATGTGSPVITSPTDGSTVQAGLHEIRVDFSDAPVGEWTVTVGTGDAVRDTVSYDFDGTNATAVLGVEPLTSPGEYSARVAGAGGTAVAESRFAVIAPPDAPTDLHATAGSHQGTLEWGVPSNDGGSSVAAYQVELDSSDATQRDLASTTRSYQFRNLTNGTTYRLSVRARNAAGDGPWASVEVTPVSVPSRPSSAHAKPRSHSATLSWSYLANHNGGTSLLGYQVQVGRSAATRHNLGRSTRSHRFRHLANGRSYRFHVRARNSVGYSPWATASATPARRPYAPASTRTTASSHRATLHWRYPRRGNGGAAIDRYQVQRGSRSSTRRTVGRHARSHAFHGLRNGRTYELYVRAHNRMGYGPWARAAARPHRPPHRRTSCTSGYSPCLPPASDYDCAGGSGNGPKYAVGPIHVTGSDPYDLDRDGDGVACEQS